MKSSKQRKAVAYLLFFFAFCAGGSAFGQPPTSNLRAAAMPSSTQVKALAQYSSDAISLFNNMVTPASIIAGAIVPIGFVAPLPIANEDNKKEDRFRKTIRLLYSVVAVTSLASELLCVVWASIASNDLIESPVAKAESVWYVATQQNRRIVLLVLSLSSFSCRLCK